MRKKNSPIIPIVIIISIVAILSVVLWSKISSATTDYFKIDSPQPAHYTDVRYDEETDMGYGLSMHPTFNTGNTLLMREYEGEEVSNGQIVCFENKEEEFVCHRIVSVYDKVIVTKGDNNRYEDEVINITQLRYVVVGVLYT